MLVWLLFRVNETSVKEDTCSVFEPTHEIMALFILRELILQTSMRSHPVGLDVWFLVGPFLHFHTLCVQIAKALARLREWAGSPEPSLVAYVVSTIISWAGSFYFQESVYLHRQREWSMHKRNKKCKWYLLILKDCLNHYRLFISALIANKQSSFIFFIANVSNLWMELFASNIADDIDGPCVWFSADAEKLQFMDMFYFLLPVFVSTFISDYRLWLWIMFCAFCFLRRISSKGKGHCN